MNARGLGRGPDRPKVRDVRRPQPGNRHAIGTHLLPPWYKEQEYGRVWEGDGPLIPTLPGRRTVLNGRGARWGGPKLIGSRRGCD